MKELDLDKKTKETIQDISAISAIRPDVIRQVWEFTLMSWFLKMSENPEKEHTFSIPFVGDLTVKYKNSCPNQDGDFDTIIESKFEPSKDFCNLVGDVYYEANNSVIEYIQNNLIKNTIENIKSQPKK